MKQHIRESDVDAAGTCTAMCGAHCQAGEWKAGAAFQGLMMLGMGAEDFCPVCQRVWIQFMNVIAARKEGTR